MGSPVPGEYHSTAHLISKCNAAKHLEIYWRALNVNHGLSFMWMSKSSKFSNSLLLKFIIEHLKKKNTRHRRKFIFCFTKQENVHICANVSDHEQGRRVFREKKMLQLCFVENRRVWSLEVSFHSLLDMVHELLLLYIQPILTAGVLFRICHL